MSPRPTGRSSVMDSWSAKQFERARSAINDGMPLHLFRTRFGVTRVAAAARLGIHLNLTPSRSHWAGEFDR